MMSIKYLCLLIFLMRLLCYFWVRFGFVFVSGRMVFDKGIIDDGYKYYK